MEENNPPDQEGINYPMIYLYDFGILGELIRYNAHASIVRYEMDGIEYEVAMLNDDFEIIQELDLGLDEYE